MKPERAELQKRFPKNSRVRQTEEGRNSLGLDPSRGATVTGWSRDGKGLRLALDGIKSIATFWAGFWEPEGEGGETLQQEVVRLRAEVERLKKVEAAAQKAIAWITGAGDLREIGHCIVALRDAMKP